MIRGCKCSKCGEWHSNVTPLNRERTKWICINCKINKEGGNGEYKRGS